MLNTPPAEASVWHNIASLACKRIYTYTVAAALYADAWPAAGYYM